ncbi:MAG: capsule assembly Wzi family protein [Gemmatimonadota bacterium]|nr:capsule assembly Wzi family protein [Gemmatimonadota bacterium]
MWRRRNFLIILAAALLIPVFPGHSHGTLEETLPSYHWSYDLLDQLRLRGYFTELFVSNRPFTRGEIARSLRSIQKDIDAGHLQPTRADNWLLNQLNTEFEEETTELNGDAEANWMKVGITANLDALHRPEDLENSALIHYGVLKAGTLVREDLRSKISAGLGDRLTLYHTLRFDRNLKDDPTYVGKFFQGFAGFTEQAYLRARYGRVHIKVGRDFMVLGSGKSGTLLMSDNARTFDQYSVDFSAGFVKFTAFGIQLDDVALDSVVVRGQGPVNTAMRFINGHRLDIRLGRRANIGISEVVIYGGSRRNFELAYLNPVNFYHGTTLNDGETLGRSANTFGTIDIDVFPVENVEIFGELMIDDVKLEKANPSDLEPNRLGFMLGAQYANPFGIDGIRIRTEYTRVSNRTYNILFNEWEKFLHRNRPIGYFLGNNFDRFEMGVSGWGAQLLFFAAGYELSRQGQDNINSPYNTDYLNSTLAQGYSEPFPFGPVQKTHALNLSIHFVPSIDIRFQTDLRIAHVKNFAFTGASKTQVQFFRAGIFFNYDRLFGW